MDDKDEPLEGRAKQNIDTTRPIITLQFMAVLYLPLVMNNLDKEWIHTN
jgi:hypothetical protein